MFGFWAPEATGVSLVLAATATDAAMSGGRQNIACRNQTLDGEIMVPTNLKFANGAHHKS